MQKKYKTLGLILIVIVLIGLIITAFANRWLTYVVCQELDKNIATADSMTIRYENVQLSILTGKVKIKDIYFRSDTLSEDTRDSLNNREKIEARINAVSLDGIRYYDWLVNRRINLKGISVIQPKVQVFYKESGTSDAHGLELRQRLAEERERQIREFIRVARIFVDDATVHHINIDHAAIDTRSLKDSLTVCIPDCSVRVYDLGYSLKDSTVHFNDSLFYFSLNDTRISIPQERIDISVQQLKADSKLGILLDSFMMKSVLDTHQKEWIELQTQSVRVSRFNSALFHKEHLLKVNTIHILQPALFARINETDTVAHSTSQEALQATQAETTRQLQAKLDILRHFLTGLSVDSIQIHDISADIQSSVSTFAVSVQNMNIGLYDLGYNLIGEWIHKDGHMQLEEIPFHYNDSIYQFQIGHAHIITPDSLIELETNDIRYDNGGSFRLGKTHIRHIIDPWLLSSRMGNIPSSWIDMTISSVSTSSKNIVKEVFTLQNGFYLDTIHAEIEEMRVFRDMRYKAKHTYQLPQAYLKGLTYPFVVHHLGVNIRQIDLSVAMSKESVGQLQLGPMQIHVKNVTAIPNSVIDVAASGKIGDGNLKAKFLMTVNPACNWQINLDAGGFNLHFLDSLLYPIVGLTCGADVTHLHTSYKGDTAVANGTFCMEYTDLNIHAYKDSHSPFAVVGNLSGLINSVSKTLLNHSNPTRPGGKVLTYNVKWKNDTSKEPTLFYIGPVIDGCIETLLPGLFIHKRVKEDTSIRKNTR